MSDINEKVAEQPTDVDNTTTGYEVPMVYRVCYSCGHSEKVNVKEEDTPAMVKYCPACGLKLERLSGTELFHLNFTDEKDVLPANMEVLPELPVRDIGPGNPITPHADIAFIQAEGKVFTYQGKNLKLRMERRAHRKAFESMRSILSRSTLLEVDGKPFGRYGVFGICEGEFLDKVLNYKPVTIREIKEHKVAYVNENNYKLRIRVDEDIVEFEPKEGFPFFTKQVANTVFEDFIRQAKNLAHEPHRLLAFAMANGIPVHKESAHRDKYPVRVKPTNIRTFKLFASVLDKKDIFWRGDYNYMKVKGERDAVEAIAHKIDPYMVVTEEIASGDINPGFVVRDKKKQKKMHKWLTGMLKGKVTEMGSNPQGKITFKLMQKESAEYTNRLNVVKTMLGDLAGSFKWDNGYVYESGLTLNQVHLGESVDEEMEDDGFTFEAFFPEDIDEDKLELLQNEYEYFKGLLPEWAEVFGVDEFELPDKVNSFLEVIQNIIEETEEESGEPITQEMFTNILEDYKNQEEDIAQFVQYVTGREVPDFVSVFVLSDALAIPFLSVQEWYEEWTGAEKVETEIEPDAVEDEDIEDLDES